MKQVIYRGPEDKHPLSGRTAYEFEVGDETVRLVEDQPKTVSEAVAKAVKDIEGHKFEINAAPKAADDDPQGD